MTRQEAVERLNVSLTDAIDKWWCGDGDGDAKGALGTIGDDDFRCMAKAAMACLECSASAQDKVTEEGRDSD